MLLMLFEYKVQDMECLLRVCWDVHTGRMHRVRDVGRGGGLGRGLDAQAVQPYSKPLSCVGDEM